MSFLLVLIRIYSLEISRVKEVATSSLTRCYEYTSKQTPLEKTSGENSKLLGNKGLNKKVLLLLS